VRIADPTGQIEPGRAAGADSRESAARGGDTGIIPSRPDFLALLAFVAEPGEQHSVIFVATARLGSSRYIEVAIGLGDRPAVGIAKAAFHQTPFLLAILFETRNPQARPG
jgi:hypothetical protein